MTHPFNELLTNPPGRYGLMPYGSTTAVVLTGEPLFRERGYTLFVSFGGESHCNARFETPPPPLHTTDRADTVWFCMPAQRIRAALRLYLYTQLVRANLRDVVDAEGDFVEVVCDREDALWEEAEQLACDFIVMHMKPDYGAIPTSDATAITVEHGLGVIPSPEDGA